VRFDPATEKVVKLPDVVSVAVTVSTLDVALTPAPAGHRLIAAARLEARVVVLALVAKVPAVELPHAFEPFVPAVTAANATLVTVLVTEKAETVKSPLTLWVIVTLLAFGPPPCVALTPAAAGHALIAAVKAVALVEPVVELLTKVPLKGDTTPVHVFEAPGFRVIVFEPLVIVMACEAVVSAVLPKVAMVVLPVPLFVKLKVFDPLVMVIAVLENGEPEKVPVAFAPVPPFASVRVFDPLVIVMLPLLGAAVKVPVAWAAFALLVRVNVLVPLVTVMVGVVVDVGEPEKVPVALDAVALFVSTNAFDPLVTVMVPALGGPVKVPVAARPVALVVKLNVFDPLLIV